MNIFYFLDWKLNAYIFPNNIAKGKSVTNKQNIMMCS